MYSCNCCTQVQLLALYYIESILCQLLMVNEQMASWLLVRYVVHGIGPILGRKPPYREEARYRARYCRDQLATFLVSRII